MPARRRGQFYTYMSYSFTQEHTQTHIYIYIIYIYIYIVGQCILCRQIVVYNSVPEKNERFGQRVPRRESGISQYLFPPVSKLFRA